MKKTTRLIAALLITCLLLLVAAGCEDDDEYEHRTPAGMGSLVIDNHTVDDIFVYIDGKEVRRAPYRSDRAYDLEPGVHRVVLDQRDGDRYYADDVDILESKLTVWDVVEDSGGYMVRKWIDD